MTLLGLAIVHGNNKIINLVFAFIIDNYDTKIIDYLMVIKLTCLLYSKCLSSFDPFHEQKEASYVSYTTTMSTLAKYILSVTSAADVESNRQHLEHGILVRC